MSISTKFVSLTMLCMATSHAVAQSTVQPREIVHPDSRVLARFGHSVDISGDWIIAGSSPAYPFSTTAPGDIRFIQRTGATWDETQRFSGSSSDNLGFSVAIDGDYAVVGTPSYDNDPDTNQGKIDIYHNSNGSWSLIQTITESTPAGFLGWAVDISGGMIVASAPKYQPSSSSNENGFVYTYHDPNNDGVWTSATSVLVTPSTCSNCEIEFGNSLAINETLSGDILLAVGTVGERVYTYKFNSANMNWSPLSEISRSTSESTNFGTDLDFSDSELAISASGGNGSASIYSLSGTTWTREVTFSDSSSSTGYGVAVSFDDDHLLVGATKADFTNSNNGSIYEYLFQSGSWSLNRNYVVFEDDAGLGASVAIDGKFIAGGAPTFKVSGNSITDDGVVCIFNTTNCGAADLNNDGTLNFYDVSEFLDLYNSMDPLADWDDNGSFNFFDVSGFIQSYNEGC